MQSGSSPSRGAQRGSGQRGTGHRGIGDRGIGDRGSVNHERLQQSSLRVIKLELVFFCKPDSAVVSETKFAATIEAVSDQNRFVKMIKRRLVAIFVPSSQGRSDNL